MAYGFLNDAIENKLVAVLKDLAASNPAYRDLYITDAFPYDEIKQRGIYIEDTSANHVPLSAENYIGTKISHVFMAKIGPSRKQGRSADFETPPDTGAFIEWVREDSRWYNQRIREDLSDQVGLGNDLFVASNGDWINGLDENRPVGVDDIYVWIDGLRVRPQSIDPVAGTFQIIPWALQGQQVEVEYCFRRRPDPAGLHFLQVTSENTLAKRLLGVVRKELVIDPYAGEATITLAHQNIIPNSVRLHTAKNYLFRENVHFNVDAANGVLDIIAPDALPRRPLYVSYRWADQVETTHAFEKGQSSNQIVPGVSIAFGEKVEVGAKAVVGTLPERIDIADIYGGRFDVSMTLVCYAKDPDQRQEIVDWIALSFLGVLKERFDSEGQALTDFSLAGKARTPYVEGGDDYYTQTVSLSFQVDWELHKSFPLRVEGLTFDSPTTADYIVAAPYLPITTAAPEVFDNAFNLLERYK